MAIRYRKSKIHNEVQMKHRMNVDLLVSRKPRPWHNWGAMTSRLLCKRSACLVLIVITSLKYYLPTLFVESPAGMAARPIVPA